MRNCALGSGTYRDYFQVEVGPCDIYVTNEPNRIALKFKHKEDAIFCKKRFQNRSVMGSNLLDISLSNKEKSTYRPRYHNWPKADESKIVPSRSSKRAKRVNLPDDCDDDDDDDDFGKLPAAVPMELAESSAPLQIKIKSEPRDLGENWQESSEEKKIGHLPPLSPPPAPKRILSGISVEPSLINPVHPQSTITLDQKVEFDMSCQKAIDCLSKRRDIIEESLYHDAEILGLSAELMSKVCPKYKEHLLRLLQLSLEDLFSEYVTKLEEDAQLLCENLHKSK
ncbi:uncharacterized protein [Oscarella lobularis]|uniref:uncharacterized protein isoform X2 n=1 Tax=Oscarella lobularis TaxID=121494 RepID=UPI0033131E40